MREDHCAGLARPNRKCVAGASWSSCWRQWRRELTCHHQRRLLEVSFPLVTDHHAAVYSFLFVCLFVCLTLFYAVATVFQLYHGNDMIYEMRRGTKPEPTLLTMQGIFDLPHHYGYGSFYAFALPMLLCYINKSNQYLNSYVAPFMQLHSRY